MLNFLLHAGLTSTTYSVSKIRAIKISNIISLSAILNCLLFGLLFFYLGDWSLVKGCFWAGVIYSSAFAFTVFGKPDLGRPLMLLAGNLVIFWFACFMRGESLLQLFFFSLAVLPFMYFSWEERKQYWLALVSVFFLVLCEIYDYQFFGANQIQYNMHLLRIFSIIAPLLQIFVGFFYFLKQSVTFEKESHEYLDKLNLEHKKQIKDHKMKSLGEMAAGMAHEINNPLMVILGLTYKLNHYVDSKDMKPTIERIEATVNRIANIVQALRNFSRNASQDMMEFVSVKKIVDSTIILCRERFINTGIGIEQDIDHDLRLFCRPTEISQVLFNLMTNSYDAVLANGPEQKWIKITAKKYHDQFIEICVIDSNEGIEPGFVDRLMEPFFTTKEVGEGKGLGLSIANGIIQSHQGTLKYLPDEKNTTFQILLPIVKKTT